MATRRRRSSNKGKPLPNAPRKGKPTDLSLGRSKIRAVRTGAITLKKKNKPTRSQLWALLIMSLSDIKTERRTIMKSKTSMILNYSDLLKMEKEDPGYSAFRRGQDCFKKGNYTQAVNCFEQAVKQVPNFAVAYDFLGIAYLALGCHQQAAQSSFWAEECREKEAAKNVR